jgi:hypothetical protein
VQRRVGEARRRAIITTRYPALAGHRTVSAHDHRHNFTATWAILIADGARLAGIGGKVIA